MLLSDIELEDIDSISITFGAYPEYPLSEDDQIKLIAYLQHVEITERVPNYDEYIGINREMFILYMVDGSNISISACNPLFIVNGMGYKSNSNICENISQIYASYINIIRSESTPMNQLNN